MKPDYVNVFFSILQNLASYDYNNWIINYQNVTLSTIIHGSIWVPPDINNFKGIGGEAIRSHVQIYPKNTDYGNTGLDRTF